VVLRGLALALTGSPDLPAGAADRRALWDAAGDTVATTVLTCGLRPNDDEWLNHRAEIGAETHLTFREVRRLAPLRLPPQTVYVCENPRVLEAILDGGARAAVVCTMGNPTTVTLALLDAITASGEVQLAYHGDFDWPGIAIADRILRRYPAARPWQFAADGDAVGPGPRRGDARAGRINPRGGPDRKPAARPPEPGGPVIHGIARRRTSGSVKSAYLCSPLTADRLAPTRGPSRRPSAWPTAPCSVGDPRRGWTGHVQYYAPTSEEAQRFRSSTRLLRLRGAGHN